MSGPEWVDTLFAALFGLVAIYSARRLISRHHRPHWAVHGADLAMALGMVAMFVPSADPLPPLVWIGVFAVFGSWIGAGVLRARSAGVDSPDRGHQIHLVLSMVAMAYMVSTMTSPPTEPAIALAFSSAGGLAHEHGTGGGDMAAVNIGLALYFLMHALWSGRRLVRPVALSTGSAVTVGTVGGRLPDACHVVMGLGMSYMFVAMLG
ncbi:MAG: DUF5134 domain-containing protein [Kibdelosporangium sp.]